MPSTVVGASEPVNGVFRNNGGGVFDVTHINYGADPTGVQDSAVAIQAAITAANAAGGGVVFFPAGTYLCSKQASFNYGALGLGTMDYSLSIPMGSGVNNGPNISFRGAGRNVTFITKTTQGGAQLVDYSLFLVPATSGHQCAYVAFEDLTLDGAQSAANTPFTSAATSTHLLLAPETTYLQINRCRFQNARGGGIYNWKSYFTRIRNSHFEYLDLGDVNNCITLIGGVTWYTGELLGGHVVENCTFVNIQQIGIGVGGYSGSGDLHDVSIRGCTFVFDDTYAGTGTGGGLGVELNSGSGFLLRRTTVSDCHFHGGDGMTLDGVDTTVVGCTFHNMNFKLANCGYAIAVVSGTTAATQRMAVRDCHFDTSLGDMIVVRGAYMTVSGCTIVGAGGYGINIITGTNSATNALIKNNVITGSASGAIHDQGTATVMQGNQFTTGASRGVAQLTTGGTVTVATAEILAGDTVRLTVQAPSGTQGTISLGTISAGTSFVINSTNSSDRSYVLWEIVH